MAEGPAGRAAGAPSRAPAAPCPTPDLRSPSSSPAGRVPDGGGPGGGCREQHGPHQVSGATHRGAAAGVQQESPDSLGDAAPTASHSLSTRQLSARLGSLPALDREPLLATAEPLSSSSSTAAEPSCGDLADHLRTDGVSAVRDSASPGRSAAPAGHAAPALASKWSESGAEAAAGKVGAEPPPPPGQPAMAGQTAAPAGAGPPDASAATSWADFDAFRRDCSGSVAPEHPPSPPHSGAAGTPPPAADAEAATRSPKLASPRSKCAQGYRQQCPQQEGSGAGSAGIGGSDSAGRVPQTQRTLLPPPPASMGAGMSPASGLEVGSGRCGAAQEGRKWWQLPRTDPKPKVAPASAPRRLLCIVAHCSSARQTALQQGQRRIVPAAL